VVLSVGAGARNKDGQIIPVSVKPGDRVLLPEYGGNKVKFDETDKEYVLYRDEDILGVLDSGSAAAPKK
jgi:chaperonin GroES